MVSYGRTIAYMAAAHVLPCLCPLRCDFPLKGGGWFSPGYKPFAWQMWQQWRQRLSSPQLRRLVNAFVSSWNHVSTMKISPLYLSRYLETTEERDRQTPEKRDRQTPERGQMHPSQGFTQHRSACLKLTVTLRMSQPADTSHVSSRLCEFLTAHTLVSSIPLLLFRHWNS